VHGSLIVAVLPWKTIDILSGGSWGENYFHKHVTFASEKDMDKFLKRAHACGFKDFDDMSDRRMLIISFDSLVSGKRYSFSGRYVEPRLTPMNWTTRTDAQLERDATAAVLEHMEKDFGPLAEYNGHRELRIGNEKAAFGSIVLGPAAALFVEATYGASRDHREILAAKASFMKRFLNETNIPSEFKAIGPDAKVIPFYAARYLSKDQLDFFARSGFNTIRHNGHALSVTLASHHVRKMQEWADFIKPFFRKCR
jgi:hypothetical protein